MTVSHLLQELETAPHHVRILHMVELGHAATHDASVAATLETLEQGDFYQRLLALYACFGSHDGAHVLRSLIDPSRTIRGTAINLSVLCCDETQLRQALQLVPHDGRLPLLWKLHHYDYEALIDEFLEQLAEANDPQLRQLLPCGSPGLVRRLITPLAYTLDLTEWRRLARRHPALACALLQTRAATATSLDIQLVACANGVLPILARKQPDQAVTLVEALARTVPLTRLDLEALLSQRPVEMVDLVLREKDLAALTFDHVIHRLDTQRLLALIGMHATMFEYYHGWLSTLTPETRLALHTTFASVWRDQRGCLSPTIVEFLPRTQREQEGRRHLAMSTLATSIQQRLPYAAFLPWDEAYGLLEPYLHDPSEAIRALVLKTLTQVVRYERRRLPELLALAGLHLEEPDPVWRQIVDSLADLPRNIWRSEHLDALEPMIQHIINAFDTSSYTIGALLILVIHVWTCAPTWSATQLALIVQKHGLSFNYGCIERQLSDEDVRQIGPALRPILISWAKQGDEQKLLPLIFLFGTRIRVFDALLEALELALFNGKPSFQFGNEILSTLVQYRPARATQLIPELIQGDRDWITYPIVSNYVQQHRQDLLTPLLKSPKYCGVFRQVQRSDFSYHRRRKRFLRPVVRGFVCWTASQQATFARTLLKVINDDASDQPTLLLAIMQLAALPAVPATHVIALATDERPFVRNAALIQLAKLDNGEGIVVLQEALHDHRAKQALHALRPWFLHTLPATALALLRTIPFTRVTLAKEVVRLLGQMHGEEAYQALLALDAQDLHHDVRIAFLRALWFHLERDETWQILEREVHSADPLIALSTAHLGTPLPLAQIYHTRKRLGRKGQQQRTVIHQMWHFSEWNTITLQHLSGERLVMQAQQRLMHLYALLLQRPEVEVRAVVLNGCIRLAAADHEQELLVHLLETLNSEQEDICLTAAKSIFGTCLASDAAHIGQTIERLLPNRPALQTIIHAITPELLMQREQMLPVIRAVIEALARDPLTIGLRIGLAILFLPWDEVAHLLIEAATTSILHADALAQACHELSSVPGHYGRPSRSDSKEMGRLEEALATHPDERLRRIALATLITQATLPPGWSVERRARLESYRADPSLLVAAAAQFTVLPPAER